MFRQGKTDLRKSASLKRLDPDYEEIGPQRSSRHQEINKDGNSDIRHCDLCGSVEARVQCEKCFKQVFCLACDDMYHRHPRRAFHNRKIILTSSSCSQLRPPLPPKGSDTQTLPPPQPPPRKNKSKGLLTGSAFKKEQNSSENSGPGRTLMGSLKKFMGSRPLPPPPDQRNKDSPEANSPLLNQTSSLKSTTGPTVITKSSVSTASMPFPRRTAEVRPSRPISSASASVPPTPPSAQSQYPPLQPKCLVNRKFSLQTTTSPSVEDKRASLAEPALPENGPWGSAVTGGASRLRSQSISDEQWAQVIAAQGSSIRLPPAQVACAPPDGALAPRRGYNTITGPSRPCALGRGMTSSASVCDLNALSQQQQHFGNMHPATSFQQLRMMPYPSGIVWTPCELCQHPDVCPSNGMKRTASNLSMNLTSVGSDIVGYPWTSHPHVHHHMPIYPGYYPGYLQHMVPAMSMPGSAVSIPDSMHNFTKVNSSPAPSMRSTSHRSNKSSKSKSFNQADISDGRSRSHNRRRSESSDNSRSSSVSEDDDRDRPVSRMLHNRGTLSWQCDHCTFINPGSVKACGMCSKVPGSGKNNQKANGQRGEERIRNRKLNAECERDMSDYDREGRTRNNVSSFRDQRRGSRSKSITTTRSSCKNSRSHHRHRSISESDSLTGSDDNRDIECQMKGLRLSTRARSDYEGIKFDRKAKEREIATFRREGGSRYRNRSRYLSERSRTPGRSASKSRSRRASCESGQDHDSNNSENSSAEQNLVENKTSIDKTIVDPTEGDTLKENFITSESNNKICLSHQPDMSRLVELGQSMNENRERHDGTALNIHGKEGEKDDIHEPLHTFMEIKSPSPPMLKNDKDIEDLSFANTLDDVETMGTNEVADIDPSSHVYNEKHDGIEHSVQDSQGGITDAGYVLPTTSEKHNIDKEKPKDNVVYIKHNLRNAKEVVKQADMMQDDNAGSLHAVTEGSNTLINHDKVTKVHLTSGPVCEPSYETIEEPKQRAEEESPNFKEEFQEPNAAEDALYKTVNTEFEESIANNKEQKSLEQKFQGESLNLREGNSTEEEVFLEVARSKSSGSSPGLRLILRDTQCSSLSCSSSDAPFYSPPDSPDLSEKLNYRPTTSKAQAHVIVDGDGIVASLARDGCHVFTDGYDSLKFEDALSPSGAQDLLELASDQNALVNESTMQSDESSTDKPSNSSYSVQTATAEGVPAVTCIQDGPLHVHDPANNTIKKAIDGNGEVDERLLTVEDLIKRRNQNVMKEQGLEVVQILRDGEKLGYHAEEITIAMSMCGQRPALEWLKDNWKHMVDTVHTLATNYGEERTVNDIGVITPHEATLALRLHKGNIWAAVTECVEKRQKQVKDISNRGSFSLEDITRVLEVHQGDVDAAYLELNRTQLEPFMKKIWRSSTSETVEPPHEAPTPKPEEQEGPEDAGEAQYANVKRRLSNVAVDFYSMTVAPLLRKIGETIHKSQQKVPRISEEMKRKLAKAILDSSGGSMVENIDSENESAMEELLAVAENPSFYEYFTAVDDISKDSYEEVGAEEAGQFEDVTADSDFEPASGYPEERQQEDLQYIKREDVVVHPLKAYTHYADLSVSEFSEDIVPADNGFTTETVGPDCHVAEDSATQYSCTSDVNRNIVEAEQEAADNVSSYGHMEENAPVNTMSLQLSRSGQANQTWSRNCEDMVQVTSGRDVTENNEEESVSITTGRLSLSFTQTSDKEANIGVEAQTLLTDYVPLPPAAEDKIQGLHTESHVVQAEVTAHHVNQVETIGEKKERHELPVPDTAEEEVNLSAQEAPVSFEQATAIVGKAIAKAMARETTAKETVSRETSPQLTRSSSETQLLTNDSEELSSRIPPVLSESDDDEELLRSLGTIPEEEEFSERTESGRILSRSSSRKPPSKMQEKPFVCGASSGMINTEEGQRPEQREVRDEESKEIADGRLSETKASTLSANSVNATSSGDFSIKSQSESIPDLEPRHTNAAEMVQNATQSTVAMKTELAKGSMSAENGHMPVNLADRPVREQFTSSDYCKGVVAAVKPVSNVPPKSERGDRKMIKNKQQVNVNETAPKREEAGCMVAVNDEINKRKSERKPIQSTEGPSKVADSKGTSGAKNSSRTTSGTPTLEERHKRIPKQVDSSGDSDEEEKAVPPQLVRLGDRLKLPNILGKVEGLKARKGKVANYAEVQELKQQIHQMKQELEAQMIRSPKTESPVCAADERLRSPLTLLQKPPEEKDEAPPQRTQQERQEYEQLRFDRTVRRLLAEGQATSYEKAEMAAHLLSLSFDETDSIYAAAECSSIYTALQFLRQECELCAERYPMRRMVSMLHCTHRCCYECASTYFTYQIKAKNIRDLRCPFCNEPDLDSCPEEVVMEYFNNLDILLKTLLDKESHELFQRKLRDFTLMKDPNFRWCNKCSSGFIANPRARKLICPDCKEITCAHCRNTWEPQHEGISCEAFIRWKEANDPENQAQGVARHLAECGITCPQCKFTYALAKGGCMHFTCTECKYEFCSGCGQPFKQGSRCTVGPYCERLGLHAHHPRNCLFYLRDKEPIQLQQLLKDNGIEFDQDPPSDWNLTGGKAICLVQEQKETPEGLKDDICGRIVLEGHAGLCRLHYTEYLVEKINANRLDPVIIFDEADLRVCLRRNGKPVPVRRWESEKLYRDKLIKLIKDQLPLY